MKKLNSIGNVKANGKESDKIVLQIIDMSDKMLYNEFKAREQFITLINAAVSHELRNPLNSLIGQIESMMGFLKNLK
jgi:signal transduction histidine kinase